MSGGLVVGISLLGPASSKPPRSSEVDICLRCSGRSTVPVVEIEVVAM